MGREKTVQLYSDKNVHRGLSRVEEGQRVRRTVAVAVRVAVDVDVVEWISSGDGVGGRPSASRSRRA